MKFFATPEASAKVTARFEVRNSIGHCPIIVIWVKKGYG